MSQELHNQELKSTIGESERIAFGVPGQTGANNILWSAFKTLLANTFMSLTGNQTVAGVKSYNESPIVPAPTTGTQVANKQYVDDNSGDVSGPGASVDDNIVLFDGATGKTLKDSGVAITDKLDSTPNHIQMDTTPGVVTELEGRIYWNSIEFTLNIVSGLGPVYQAGQEMLILVYNNTGLPISNFAVMRPSGGITIGSNIVPTVELAQANTWEGVEGTIMVATMDIPDNQLGFAVRFGKARNGDTSTFTAGLALFIDPDTPGALTQTKPEFPNYAISIGGALNSESSPNGEIFVTVTRNFSDTVLNFWNGTIRESFDFRVTSDGATITGSLEPTNGHPDLTLIFSDDFFIFDTSPVATITLTPGTDTNPQINYVYIPQSTKLLTISTSDWPTTQHVKVAVILLKSAATTQIEDALVNQNWNDHIQDTISNQGHLSHIGEALRAKLSATWQTGVEGSIVIDGSFNVYAKVTAGKVYQLHIQEFPVINMELGDIAIIVNNFATPFVGVANLDTQTLDALGNSLANKSFSFVMWGVQNKTGETSHLMFNLPNGSYPRTSPGDAANDALNYSVYDIPKNYISVGFLIARFTFVLQADGITWSLYETEDLRGKIPNTTAGGGAGGASGVISYLGLIDTKSSYAGDAGKFPKVSAGETSLESSLMTEDVNGNLSIPGRSLVDGQAHGGYNLETFSASKTFDVVNGNNQEMPVTGDTTINITDSVNGGTIRPGSYMIWLPISTGTSPTITVGSSFGNELDNSGVFKNSDGSTNIISLVVSPSGLKEYAKNIREVLE